MNTPVFVFAFLTRTYKIPFFNFFSFAYLIFSTGQQVFRIEIADKNDHPPKFSQERYVAEAIPEDANNNALVTEVKALDNDTGTPITSNLS